LNNSAGPVPIIEVKIVPDNTSTIKDMKVMLMKKLSIDADNFDLVVLSLKKSKKEPYTIETVFDDSVEA